MEQNNAKVSVAPRITVIDALRGFALLGVVLMHMLQHFGVFSGIQTEEARFPMADEVIQWISQNVIMGRFVNIFAFLFGLSFFIQMDRAAKKGIDFRKRFLWRMLILFVIGMIGNSFFTADILSIYAIFGVIMVFLFPLKNKILIMIACLLLLGTPRLLMVGYDRLTQTEQIAVKQSTNPARPNFQETNSSYFKSAKANLTTGYLGKLRYQFGLNSRGYITLALFIFGLIVGRLRFFEEVLIKQRRNIILLIGFSGAFAITKLIVNFAPIEILNFRMILTPGFIPSPGMLLITTINDISVVLFSAALALGFIVLYQLKSIGRYLDVLSPYGRMALTNYEMQGILGAILFYTWGFGSIFGSWGITEVFVLGLVLYTLQAIFSKYWLKYFQYGPLEWFWRSATYLKKQPFARKS